MTNSNLFSLSRAPFFLSLCLLRSSCVLSLMELVCIGLLLLLELFIVWACVCVCWVHLYVCGCLLWYCYHITTHSWSAGRYEIQNPLLLLVAHNGLNTADVSSFSLSCNVSFRLVVVASFFFWFLAAVAVQFRVVDNFVSSDRGGSFSKKIHLKKNNNKVSVKPPEWTNNKNKEITKKI